MSTAIPDDILAVAAVVTGDDRTNLTGWQRRHAIAAMTALGYSGRHIAWALNATRDAVYQAASKAGIRLNPTDQRLDQPAIDMVVSGTARLHLTGADRVEVVRLMAEQHTSSEIAYRLRCGADEVARIARNLGLTLRQSEPWNWYAYTRSEPQRQAVAA